MYIPPWFREEDTTLLHALMRQFSFATLVTQSVAGIDGPSLQEARLVASHLPFVLDDSRGPYGTLRAHMARANPQWEAFAAPAEAPEVLVLFQGPHAYISPSWYTKHPSVPTWNYAVVHAYGTPRLLGEDELLSTLQDSVTEYESGFAQPWSMQSLPDAYVDGMARAIVGIEIEITRLEGKFKLSQNRSTEDQHRVIVHLSRSHNPLDLMTAEWMQRRQK